MQYHIKRRLKRETVISTALVGNQRHNNYLKNRKVHKQESYPQKSIHMQQRVKNSNHDGTRREEDEAFPHILRLWCDISRKLAYNQKGNELN